MVFGPGGDLLVKEQVDTFNDNIKNPYFDLFHWCKQEIFDIESLSIAVRSKDKIR